MQPETWTDNVARTSNLAQRPSRLDTAYRERSAYRRIVTFDFAFEKLRSNPKFQDFLERVGLCGRGCVSVSG